VGAWIWPARLVVAVALIIPAAARAQIEPSAALDGVDGAAVLGALARECYDAGLAPDMPSDSIMDCSGVIEERSTGALTADEPNGDGRIVITHRLRFSVLERAEGGRVSGVAWTETEELGGIVEQPVTSEDYLRRVQRVLTAVIARLREQVAPPWAGRYESEQAWHLAAHLRAVSHCDANLASMTAESVAAELETIGLRAIDDDTRDRCEQLYTHLFEWGLARGDTAPTVAKYARYRAALPAEQRLCGGLLAPDAVCRP
jgi:hypothetical protein